MMLVLGVVLIGVAAVLDSFFRLRMEHIGEKWALLRGGAFDYSRYHKARKEQGWAAWPVYVHRTYLLDPVVNLDQHH